MVQNQTFMNRLVNYRKEEKSSSIIKGSQEQPFFAKWRKSEKHIEDRFRRRSRVVSEQDRGGLTS